MKKNVLVTLADSEYISQAKQLFSGAHFNAGWAGDFLLLSHNISEKELTWFRRRGIFIKHCNPLSNVGRWRPVSSSKLYIFSEEFKKWEHVLYLDADIIVRGSLDHLLDIEGYAAAPDLDQQSLIDQFDFSSNKNAWKIYETVLRTVKRKYMLSNLSFNTGVILFSTNIITKDMFRKLVFTLRLVKDISAFGEQTAQNIFFYNNWYRLPIVYNLQPLLYIHNFGMKKEAVQSINLHFAGLAAEDKPWHRSNPYYYEWKNSLEKADALDRKHTPQAQKVWSKKQIWMQGMYFQMYRRWYFLKTKL